MKKILVEGLVIVASIFLAFGIDAAWDARQQGQAENQLLRALLEEIDVNGEELEHRRTQGAATRDAQLELIELIGPRAGTLAVDSLDALLRTSMSFGTAEIESAALDAVLVGSAPPTPSRTHLLRLLRLYRTELEDHRQEDRRQWIDNRSKISQYLIAVSPFAFVWAETSGHRQTGFDVPVAALLRDPLLEGMFSQLSVRALPMTRTIDRLKLVADSIGVLAKAELGGSSK